MKQDITFDNRARQYDNGYEGHVCERFYQNIVEAVQVQQKDHLLDIGCGTGTVLHRLSSKASFIGYGIDISTEMLAVARQKCANVQFTKGDCSALPYADNSMDVITTCMAYHHFPSQEGFRLEAFRVLKPGGRLYVCDPRFPLVIRGALNLFFNVRKTNARFYKGKALKQAFLDTGFTYLDHKKDLYVQVLVMTK